MKAWFHFGVPAGQSLVIAGYLDLLIGLAKCLHASMRSVYSDDHRKELTDYSFHLGGKPEKRSWNSVKGNVLQKLNFVTDYLELTQAAIEGSKIVLAVMLWIGVILIGRIVILKLWIYATIVVDLIQLLLIGVINYHFWLTDATTSVSPVHFIYLTSIRLLIRLYLIVVALNYSKVYSKFRAKVEISTTSNATPAIQQRHQESQNELARELMPIGMGAGKLFQFYLGDADRLARFLLISDLVWCICKVLSREVSQAVFGRNELFYPSSSFLTPILVEERVIRISRIVFDIIFLQSIHKETLAHQNWWILPKVMETIVSVGILGFVTVTEKTTFPTFVTGLFVTFFMSDLLFRFLILGTCLRSYTNHCEKSTRRGTQSR